MQSCGNEASPATALNCWLAVNSLRWAAGVPATAAGGTNGTNSFRLAISNNIVSSTTITNIKAAAVSKHGTHKRVVLLESAGFFRGVPRTLI